MRRKNGRKRRHRRIIKLTEYKRNKKKEILEKDMDSFVNANQKHLPPVGNLFAKPMSDKMYYVNQRQ